MPYRKKVLWLAAGMTLLAGLLLVAAPWLTGMWARYQLHARELDKLPFEEPADDAVNGLKRKLLESRFVDTACQGNIDDARLFLRAGYPASARSIRNSLTALHCAAFVGDLAWVRELLDHKADPVARTERDELQPIHFAAAMGRIDVIKLLIKHGASINEPSRSGTPVVFAFTPNPWDISGRTLRKAPLGRPPTPADVALLNEFKAVGAHLDGTNEHGEGLLHLAAQLGDVDLVKELLRLGLPADARNQKGETPLLSVARAQGGNAIALQTNIALALLDAGADVNARDANGANAFCSSLRRPRLLEALLARGLDPNIAPTSGGTCWRGLRSSMTPREIIDLADRISTLSTPLRADGSPGAGPLFDFAADNDPELVQYFLGRGLRPIDRGPGGYGVLHAALKETGGAGDHAANRESIVRRLLDAGADINQQDDSGITPIMVATRQPPGMIHLLVTRGAEVNHFDARRSKSTLELFLQAGNLQSAQILRAAGAK